MDKYKEVTDIEYQTFVLAYPHKLNFDVAMMCEPPLRSYNDFTLGDFPDSIVASQSGNKYLVLKEVENGKMD